jgi:hypothetical protein
MVTKSNRKKRIYPGRNQKGLYKRGVNSTIVFRKSIGYEGTYCVYALTSSDKADVVRYIGVTAGKLNIRYNGHCNPRKEEESNKARWVREVLGTGNKLVLVVIEEGIETYEDACQAEKDYIRGFRDAGAALTNMTAGGIGTNGLKHKKETKLKQRDSWKQWGMQKNAATVIKMASDTLAIDVSIAA